MEDWRPRARKSGSVAKGRNEEWFCVARSPEHAGLARKLRGMMGNVEEKRDSDGNGGGQGGGRSEEGRAEADSIARVHVLP